MSRGLRVVLLVVAVALFLCCVAGLGVTLLGTRLVGRAFITNPDRVQAVGRAIADYEVPPDYEEIFAMNIMGVKMVAIGPADPAADILLIMLMQFPGGVDISREEMERQVRRALARQTGLGSADMTSVGQEEVVIKGETITLEVREGANDRGQNLRQISGLFQGKGGPAMLMVTGEVASWDQAMLDRFIESIR
ncbi:MAG: hypothetical protein JSV81_22920 [Anaerolineales bacterium]|nr:MAG: hypothetical protein JSV81_22920 [Anaerolineales bacterium]